MKFAATLALITLSLGCAVVDPRSRQEKARDFLAKHHATLEPMAKKLLRDPKLICLDDPSGRALCVKQLANGRYVSMILDGYDLQYVEASPLRDFRLNGRQIEKASFVSTGCRPGFTSYEPGFLQVPDHIRRLCSSLES